MGRLRSSVWVSASFQIFALTAGGVLGGKGNCPAPEMSGENMSEGEMSRTRPSCGGGAPGSARELPLYQ